MLLIRIFYKHKTLKEYSDSDYKVKHSEITKLWITIVFDI